MIMRDSVEKSKRYYGLRYVGLATSKDNTYTVVEKGAKNRKNIYIEI